MMSKLDELLREAGQIPEPALDEVLDFVRFLKSRSLRERWETALASERALAQDWLSPEEDAAWQDL
jgi:hypothetical protein